MHLVVSLHVKVHGTEYAHAITHPLTHSHTHTRVDVTQKSKMVDGSVGIVMETLSSSSAGPLTLGKIGQSADSISLGYF